MNEASTPAPKNMAAAKSQNLGALSIWMMRWREDCSSIWGCGKRENWNRMPMKSAPAAAMRNMMRQEYPMVKSSPKRRAENMTPMG